MTSKSDNADIMTYDNANEVIIEIFESVLFKINSFRNINEREKFYFQFPLLWYYKCYKISFKCVGSYTESLHWMEDTKAAINPKTKNDKCFQYAATVALTFDEIKKDLQRFPDIKPFINKYN